VLSWQTPLGQLVTARHSNAGLLLQLPGVRHWRSVTQLLPFFAPAPVHLPEAEGHPAFVVQAAAGLQLLPGQPPLLVHACPAFAPPAQVLVWHTPPTKAGHWAADWHTVLVGGLLHTPFFAGQVAAVWHTALGGLLQVPGQSAFTRQDAPPSWQVPAAGQSEFLAQAWLVLLQVPPTMVQSLTDVQRLRTMLHWPMAGQLDCCMQLAPLTLQAPGCGVQSEFWVQLLVVWMLQRPGSGVQTGGAQVVTGAQGFSGSGGSRLQPGGL
jgi:hypothetical protein